MAVQSPAYYRLERIDDGPLPADLKYNDGRCVVTDGDLVVRPGEFPGGDGIICIRVFGTIYGRPEVHQISLERHPFDRLDREHLTFPGGLRRQRHPPHSVVRYTEAGLEVTPLASESTVRSTTRAYGPHR